MERQIANVSNDGQDKSVPHQKKQINPITRRILLTYKEVFQTKGFIKTGRELGEFIDETYQCDQKSLDIVLEKASISEIVHFVNENDDFLERAAEKLSYSSLYLLIDLGQTPFLRSKFTKDSTILKKFIQNLKVAEMKKKEKRQLLTALLYFNLKDVESEVLDCGNHELIKLFFRAKQELPDYEESASSESDEKMEEGRGEAEVIEDSDEIAEDECEVVRFSDLEESQEDEKNEGQVVTEVDLEKEFEEDIQLAIALKNEYLLNKLRKEY